jgi:glyoxylase I family protein
VYSWFTTRRLRRIDAKAELPPDPVRQSAQIIRSFIEDYHEKLEEDYLFPRFERAGKLTDLTGVLRVQHQAGRRLTEQITQLATVSAVKDVSSSAKLREAMRQFVRMYAPHEAREDTVLFPALRTIVSKQEFGALGEEFEKKEHQLFGDDGFEKMVDRVATIERAAWNLRSGTVHPARVEPFTTRIDNMDQPTSLGVAADSIRSVHGVRNQVADVARAVSFYAERLGFTVTHQQLPAFASVSLGGVNLLLSGPGASGSRPMPNGTRQEPGGWNRIVLRVSDLATCVAALRDAGVTLRNDIETGPGGRQVQIEDPDGNPVELFEPGQGR